MDSDLKSGRRDFQGRRIHETSSECVTMGKREAWLKFVAYQAASEICVAGLLAGVSHGKVFLEQDSNVLKESLAIKSLMLHNGRDLYWDDADPSQDGDAMRQSPGKKIMAMPKWQGHDVKASPEVGRRDITTDNKTPKKNVYSELGVPIIECSVVRVIGSPYLDEITYDASPDDALRGHQIQVKVLYGAIL